jgi:hypothetical protein
MDKTKELKLMQKHPKFYLANFFSDLKRQVDLTFALKLNEKKKYIEIISKIESFEQECYNIKPFDTFNNEIQSIEQQILNNNNNNNKIDDIKYKIERKLFNNKSILFMKDYGKEKKTFLLIINDEYVRKKTIDDLNSEYFNREHLIAHYLSKKLNSKEINFTNNILYLNIDIINQTSLIKMNSKIHQIDKNTFNGLIKLKKIHFINNKIKDIQPTTFNGLTNLEEIIFSNNQINRIRLTLFSGLTKLKKICFDYNQLTNLHEYTFKSLNKLEEINFSNNLLKELNLNLFNNLICLKIINFAWNQIEHLHSLTFIGLDRLQIINFNCNKIKKYNPSILVIKCRFSSSNATFMCKKWKEIFGKFDLSNKNS